MVSADNLFEVSGGSLLNFLASRFAVLLASVRPLRWEPSWLEPGPRPFLSLGQTVPVAFGSGHWLGRRKLGSLLVKME